MQTYTASDGDTVEYVAWRVYGTQDGRVVEKLLEANPGVADLGPTLPAGTQLYLPTIDTKAERTGVRLWS